MYATVDVDLILLFIQYFSRLKPNTRYHTSLIYDSTQKIYKSPHASPTEARIIDTARSTITMNPAQISHPFEEHTLMEEFDEFQTKLRDIVTSKTCEWVSCKNI